MSQKRKKQIYSKEQKADAVKSFMDSDDDNCSESANALGIAPSTLRCWIRHKNLRAAIFEYIEVFYNRKKHSTNGNLSPVDYENSCIKSAAMAA